MTVWARVVLVGSDGQHIAAWPVAGAGRPDITTVDALARYQLWARRNGAAIRLVDLCDELGALLDAVGLRRQVGG